MKPYIEWKVGDEDIHGVITKIYSAGPNYIFYETDNRGNIASNVAGANANWQSPINSKLPEIFALLPNTNQRRKYAQRISSAFVDCLCGDNESALYLLENIKQTIIYSYKIRARLSYLISAIGIIIINILLVVLINTIYINNFSENLRLLFNIATYGSFGGFISISFTFKKIDIGYEDNFFIPILTGLSRIFISMISSIIVFSIIKSDLVLGVLTNTNNKYVFYALGALSGFSESFVPNILKSWEKENPPSA